MENNNLNKTNINKYKVNYVLLYRDFDIDHLVDINVLPKKLDTTNELYNIELH